MIFKVDIEKAYDSLNWGFLFSVLEQMNFTPKWRRWISAILEVGRASILVNGSPTLEFDCSRGLRQADPLSPILFVLAMEMLTGFMKRAERVGLYNELRCGFGGPKVFHLLYADDVIYVGEWEKRMW
ncbi:putative mitochondrial protein AtMg01250 [Bidens hawaiensis]|uniref:putative mitochondrial protein AtMg01250 n=1 Tax=Bidens hawaiensis TaxID=980011 RepID=UPI004049C644